MRTSRRLQAFTLIELLVVVAIIALLISILLPALRAAKEQGKMAKCLSNLKSLNTSTATYLVEYDDKYPFLAKNGDGWVGICSWAYGGKKTDDYWKDQYGGIFYFESNERPLNLYIVGAEVGPLDPVPSLQCPSDQGSYQRVYDEHPWEQEPFTAYDDIGTSYHYNLHGFTDLSDFDPMKPKKSWERAHTTLFRDGLNGFAARYAMYFEDPVDWCINEKVQIMGNHKQFSTHAIGFMDGHANYLFMDTRKWCDSGWTFLNPNWLKHDDYTPKVYYTDSSHKTCD